MTAHLDNAVPLSMSLDPTVLHPLVVPHSSTVFVEVQLPQQLNKEKKNLGIGDQLLMFNNFMNCK